MSNLTTLPKGDSAWLLRKSIQRIMQQVSVLETNIGSSTTGNSSDTQIIFNDAGTLRGDSGLTYNKTTDLLSVGSATITGNLTVNGSYISCGNNSYIRTDAANLFSIQTGSLGFRIMNAGNSALFYGIDSASTSTWYDGAGGTRMTLNSTGLGVGAVPSNYRLYVSAAFASGLNGAYIECGEFNRKSLVVNHTNALVAVNLFEVQKTGTAQFLVDSSGNVGIGASPAQKLTVAGSAEITGGVVGQGALIGRDGSSGGATYSSNTGNTNVNAPASGSVRFNVNNGVFAGVFDANANLGIGVTPSAWGAGYTPIQGNGYSLYSGNNQQVRLSSNEYINSSAQSIYRNSAAAALYQQNAGVHNWWSAPSGTAGNAITFTQAMTLDASGNLLVGTTGNGTSARTIISQASSSLPALYLSGGAGTTPLINFNGAGRMRSDGQYLVMETTNASGVIYVTANTNGVYLAVGGTSWTANSDERLKDIIEPISNAVSKVGSLRSVIGKFKNDETNTRRSFLIAQDVQAVLPEAVDASNPDRLGVAYTEVIPLLVAAIKELTARVQTLETR